MRVAPLQLDSKVACGTTVTGWLPSTGVDADLTPTPAGATGTYHAKALLLQDQSAVRAVLEKALQPQHTEATEREA